MAYISCLQVTSAPSQGFLGLNNGGQVGGRVSSAYKGASVPLVEVWFKVKAGVLSGTHTDTLHFGSLENPIVLTSVSSGGASINVDKKIGDVCRRHILSEQSFLLASSTHCKPYPDESNECMASISVQFTVQCYVGCP